MRSLPAPVLALPARRPSASIPNRDSNNRGNTYPPPLWLADPKNFTRDTLPAWDCNNAGGEHAATSSEQACWVAPPLPGAKAGQIPHIMQAHYPDS